MEILISLMFSLYPKWLEGGGCPDSHYFLIYFLVAFFSRWHSNFSWRKTSRCILLLLSWCLIFWWNQTTRGMGLNGINPREISITSDFDWWDVQTFANFSTRRCLGRQTCLLRLFWNKPKFDNAKVWPWPQNLITWIN